MKKQTLFLLAVLPLILGIGSLLWLQSRKIDKPQIYDCFLFYNELELLQIHLAELNDHVDKFVLVEAVETFTGKPKALFYDNNQELFETYKDKIIHVIVSDRYETDDPWIRERFQRDAILNGLNDCKNHDIILLTDVDEIINSKKIPTVIDKLEKYPHSIFTMEQQMSLFFINRRLTKPWKGTTASRYVVFKKHGPENVRRMRTECPVITDGGWHLSSLGGFDRYITKIESFSHTEADVHENKTLDAYQEGCATLKLVPIDDSFPQYIRDHQEELKEAGLIQVL